HLFQAGAEDRAAAVIAERGNFWIETGALLSLASFAAALPAGVLAAHPRALSYRAEVFRLQGDYGKAETLFRQAAKALRANGDAEGEAEVWHSLAAIARRRGETATAFALLDRAAALTDESSPVRVKCGNTRGLCLHANGDWVEAETEFRLALQLAEEQGDEHHARIIAHNLGLPAMVRGNFGEALRWLRRMFRAEDSGQALPPLPQEATALLNMARCSLYRGELRNCEELLDGALERCQTFHLTALHGEVFETYGNLYRETGESARAAEFYERAARAYGDNGVELTRHELLEEQALLFLRLGDAPRALALLDRLIAERRKSQMGVGTYTAQLARSRVLLAEKQFDRAEADLQLALAYFREHQLHYYEAQTSLALAACADARGARAETLTHLRRVLDLAARYDYEYWLRKEAESNSRVFTAPEALELLPPEIRELINSIAEERSGDEMVVAVRKAITPVAVTGPAVDLTINMLGPVEIYRDPARPFAADAWVTRRARDILCYLASRTHRRASKDTIIDTFWGEADPTLIGKNFHPTISHIRKALNSNQSLKQNFLLYRDGDYILNPDYSYRFDHEEFDRLVREGEAARRAGQGERGAELYEAAGALYRGDFMQNCFDEWVEEQRAYYQEQYLRILEALTATAHKAAEWDRVTVLAQKILRVDPFREDIHGLQMRAAAATNNRAAVKEHYEALKRLLRKELGVEPAGETQRLYRELMK
ncbi:MAG TPA: BTAD domain-containing putative transcriptional regulator, partial [Pyrinomonadaceae bacterium]|nr:BTAD domain-containing putative transcriptional regulator [Pyrinomonadaceae bacterium]